MPLVGTSPRHSPEAFKALASKGFLVTPAAPSATPRFQARVGFHDDALLLAITAPDATPMPTDSLRVTLVFPSAGVPAARYTYRLGPEGKQPAAAEDATPAFVLKRVQARVLATATGYRAELTVPVTALPRFPWKDPPAFELCIEQQDRSPEGHGGSSANCDKDGVMSGDNLVLPATFRRALKLSPPEGATAVQAMASGYAAFDLMRLPLWVVSDAALTVDSARNALGEPTLDPAKLRLALPAKLSLPDGSPLVAVVVGKDPFAQEGACHPDDEVRLGLYSLKQKTALRVLEWPASTCALGRASSVELDEQGALTIGYSGGGTVSFVWSRDHFERTQLGAVTP